MATAMRTMSFHAPTRGQAFLLGLGSTSLIFPTSVAMHSGWAGKAAQTSEWDALRTDWARLGADFAKAKAKAREIQARHESLAQR